MLWVVVLCITLLILGNNMQKFINTATMFLVAIFLTACSCNNKVKGGMDGSDPAMAAVNQQLRSTAGDRVWFAYDSSALSDEAKATLDKQMHFMHKHSNVKFVLEGHADERGTREYNLALGERRAEAAKHYLVFKGVDPQRLEVMSYGKERPEVDGHDQAAWQQNRRAVTVAVSRMMK